MNEDRLFIFYCRVTFHLHPSICESLTIQQSKYSINLLILLIHLFSVDIYLHRSNQSVKSDSLPYSSSIDHIFCYYQCALCDVGTGT